MMVPVQKDLFLQVKFWFVDACCWVVEYSSLELSLCWSAGVLLEVIHLRLYSCRLLFIFTLTTKRIVEHWKIYFIDAQNFGNCINILRLPLARTLAVKEIQGFIIIKYLSIVTTETWLVRSRMLGTTCMVRICIRLASLEHHIRNSNKKTRYAVPIIV